MIETLRGGILILVIFGSGLCLPDRARAIAPQEPEAADEEERTPRLASVEAPVLTGITIDGDLSDWPDTIELHPIDNILVTNPSYGWNGLEGVDLGNNPDLSAFFSVAYDPDEQLIYLVVIVRDDELVVGHRGVWDTDAVEVYLDGRFSEDTISSARIVGREETVSAAELPMLQYLGVPGEGPIYGVERSEGEARGPVNPTLSYGDIEKTATKMAFRRDGDVTIYEWALQAFDRYPDEPTELVPGKRIGFDVVVLDRDVPATTDVRMDEPMEIRSAWISWCPGFRGPRFLNASTIGELVLGPIPDPH